MFENIIETLYTAYIEKATGDDNIHEARLSGLSCALDSMIRSGNVSEEAVSMYEEAARRAGFYAGIRAAVQYLSEADDLKNLLEISEQHIA